MMSMRWTQSSKYGWTSVRVLPELDGQPWDVVTQAFIRALRPSYVRVIEYGQGEQTDARVWRVTVHLDERRRVESIEQEVEVDLPDGVAHGHALSLLLDADRTGS